jgi:hypothetical protein
MSGWGWLSPAREPTGCSATMRSPLRWQRAGVRFYSRPDLTPPTVTLARRAGSVADGFLFLAPSSGPGRRGTLIVDAVGEPVWFHPTTPVTAMNLRAAVYKGAPVLTWWEGKTERGLGTGTHVILDRSYRVVARVPAGAGRPSDLHEFLLTPHGTALVTSWEVAPKDLRGFGGPSAGKVVGGIVQELELPSGRVLFEWRSLDHVPIGETHAEFNNPLDYFHINSVELAADGNLLVSARNTWAVYKIDRGSGRVIWRLGGKRSDFRMGPGTRFAWQHDAREHGSLLSLFNNGAAPKVLPQSAGLVLALDTKRMRATLQRKYTHAPAALARALGSVQVLPNGNVLVGWGTEPYLTEYSAGGRVLLDARLPPGGQNYRALRFPWLGQPSVPPKLVAHRAAGATGLYASWNGATEVGAWQLRSGPAAGSLSDGVTMPRGGFETKLPLPPGDRYAAVVALDQRGKALRTSRTIRI